MVSVRPCADEVMGYRPSLHYRFSVFFSFEMGDSDIHLSNNWTSSLCAAPTAWPSTVSVVWMAIPSWVTPWAAQSTVVLFVQCNCCQNAPGAEAGASLSGAGWQCQEPHMAGASGSLCWDTFPTVYHPMHKGSATWKEVPGTTFEETRGVDGFIEATNWQQLQVQSKSRRKMRIREIPSDCTRQHLFRNCINYMQCCMVTGSTHLTVLMRRQREKWMRYYEGSQWSENDQ